MSDLRERVARALCRNRAGPACDCRARGVPCRGLRENLLHESNEFAAQADAAIALCMEEAARCCEDEAERIAKAAEPASAVNALRGRAAAIRALIKGNTHGQ